MEKDLANIISSRLDQMINPLMEILNEEVDRYRVLYITGGGAMLKGIDQYLQQKTRIPVMYGSHASFLSTDTDDEMCMPIYSSLVGTLLLGNEYRKKHPLAAANNTGLPIFQALREMTLDLFTEQETNRKQANE
jgi:actin-like ATPase involved in cell morphogenesis